MNKSIISDQLKHDYPDYKIYLDEDRRMVVADDHKMSLLNSPAALQTMNIFSRSGRSFYQAIAQLLCSNYKIIPKEGSYADHLIIRPEDLNKYKVQKLAKEWGIGFLETNEDILAVKVDDGIERDLLLESPKVIEELFEEEYFPENKEVFPYLSEPAEEEDWAELVEVDFDVEMAYLEKGIEFATAMEEVESIDKELLNEIEDLEGFEVVKEKINKSESNNNKKGILNSILKILKL